MVEEVSGLTETCRVGLIRPRSASASRNFSGETCLLLVEDLWKREGVFVSDFIVIVCGSMGVVEASLLIFEMEVGGCEEDVASWVEDTEGWVECKGSNLTFIGGGAVLLIAVVGPIDGE